MTILSPSGLETDDYGEAGWHAIHNKNIDKFHRVFRMLQNLLDIDTDNLKDGSILTWDETAGKWKCKNYE